VEYWYLTLSSEYDIGMTNITSIKKGKIIRLTFNINLQLAELDPFCLISDYEIKQLAVKKKVST